MAFTTYEAVAAGVLEKIKPAIAKQIASSNTFYQNYKDWKSTSGSSILISTTGDTTDWSAPYENGWGQLEIQGSPVQGDKYKPGEIQIAPGTYQPMPGPLTPEMLQDWEDKLALAKALHEAAMLGEAEPEKPKKELPAVEPRRRRKICLPGRDA